MFLMENNLILRFQNEKLQQMIKIWSRLLQMFKYYCTII